MTDTPAGNLMSTSATDLKRSCPSTASLKIEIKKHIKAIESKIKEAHRGKLRSIRYEMIANFEIPNLSNRNAQLHIFAAIIEQLEMNDYGVEFVHDKKNCYFNITWLSQQDKDEALRQEEIIKKAKEKKEAMIKHQTDVKE